MADSIGLKAKMGIKEVVSWASSYAAVDDPIPFTDENIIENWERIQKQALLGYGGREKSDQGNRVVQGTTNHELDYDNFIPIIEHIMGAESAGVITIEDQLAKYLFIEIEKQVSRFRAGPSKGKKFTIKGDAGDNIKLACEWHCRKVERSATAFPAIAPAAADRLLFSQMVFRIGDQANALTSGDAVGLASFELEFDRQMHTGDYASDATTPKETLDPIEGDFRTCMLKIKIPRYAADTFATWKAADTSLQADLTFTGPSAKGFLIQLPELKITEGFDAPVGGPGPLTLEGSLEAYRSSNAYMYTGNEMKITVS